MATAYTQPAQNPVEQLAGQPRVARALSWLEKNTAWVTDQQARITAVPAPTFLERDRALLLKKLLEEAGLRARLDRAGNVVAERPGAARDVVLVSAHLDTVFPPSTDLRLRRQNGRLYAPGISDNGTGLATLVALANVVQEAGIRTQTTLVFAANVAEEGEGNLAGMRQLVEALRPRLRYCVVLDGTATDHVTTMALASKRLEVTVTGPGGHSWSDFGLPNPIQALGRAIARLARVRLPEKPRTSLNIGEIRGGTSVNSIPDRASIKLDIRSESEAEIQRVEAAVREAVQAAVEEETASARLRGVRLEWQVRVLGVRPGGALPASSPLLAAVRDAEAYLGHVSRLERSSTDANLPLSLGIPAVTLGGGGQAGGAHSPGEWYDPAGRELGLKRALLTVLAVAGVQP